MRRPPEQNPEMPIRPAYTMSVTNVFLSAVFLLTFAIDIWVAAAEPERFDSLILVNVGGDSRGLYALATAEAPVTGAPIEVVLNFPLRRGEPIGQRNLVISSEPHKPFTNMIPAWVYPLHFVFRDRSSGSLIAYPRGIKKRDPTPVITKVPPATISNPRIDTAFVDDSPSQVLIFNREETFLIDFITGQVSDKGVGHDSRKERGSTGPVFHKATSVLTWTADGNGGAGEIYRSYLRDRGRHEVIKVESPFGGNVWIKNIRGDSSTSEFIVTTIPKPVHTYFCKISEDGKLEKREITDFIDEVEIRRFASGDCVRVGDMLYSCSLSGEFMRGVKVPPK